MNYKIVAYVIVGILALFGAWQVGRGGLTLYRDYQDFKAIRAWAVQVNQQQQKAAKARQQLQATPDPAPPGK